MKKFTIMLVVAFIAVACFGQRSHRAALDASAKFEDNRTDQIISMPFKMSPSTQMKTMSAQEMYVGFTHYDLQSNATLSNRFWRNNNGNLVATWTGGVEPTVYNDRGSFYNYFNGQSWQIQPEQTTRIEPSLRSGWPSYAPLGAGEVIASHHTGGTALYKRDVQGEGNWQTVSTKISSVSATSWPRICVNDGVIHVLECASGDFLRYSRSADGGLTWAPSGQIFDQLGSDNYNVNSYGADGYVWAVPNAGTIAFCVASNRADLVIMKSTDNGQTWEKIVPWQHPVPNFDVSVTGQAPWPDSLFCPNGAHSLLIDDNGMCHLAFNVNKYRFNPDTPGMYYFLYLTHAFYWNEEMPVFTNSNQFRALDPDKNPEYLEDGRCYLYYGFDWNGDGDWFDGNYVSHRGVGMMPGVHIALAGPKRIVFALNLEDESALIKGGYMASRIFLCSYIYDDIYQEWRFDQNWVTDPNMVSHDLDTGDLIQNLGWFRMNASYIHALDECVYPQILIQPSTSDDGNMYIFFNIDDFPGTSIDSPGQYSPQANIVTDNYIVVYCTTANLGDPKFPELGISSSDKQNKLLIYPNPASKSIQISVEEAVNCVILNLTGQIVAKCALSSGVNSIDISNLHSGVYVVNAGNYSQKLIVK